MGDNNDNLESIPHYVITLSELRKFKIPRPKFTADMTNTTSNVSKLIGMLSLLMIVTKYHEHEPMPSRYRLEVYLDGDGPVLDTDWRCI